MPFCQIVMPIWLCPYRYTIVISNCNDNRKGLLKIQLQPLHFQTCKLYHAFFECVPNFKLSCLFQMYMTICRVYDYLPAALDLVFDTRTSAVLIFSYLEVKLINFNFKHIYVILKSQRSSMHKKVDLTPKYNPKSHLFCVADRI